MFSYNKHCQSEAAVCVRSRGLWRHLVSGVGTAASPHSHAASPAPLYSLSSAAGGRPGALRNTHKHTHTRFETSCTV